MSPSTLTKPYAILSDLHLHNWQAFSAIDETTGVNTRLAFLLAQVRSAAERLLAEGGDTMYIAGDLFHVRGNIAPSVLNPVLDLFKEIIAMGIKVRIIPGNHDLEGKHSERLGSAVTALEGIGAELAHQTKTWLDGSGLVTMIPWFDKLDDLRAELEDMAQSMDSNESRDVIIHAPLNGVITGLPDHGLSHEELTAYGFRRVFAGHYHNHKDFDGKVFSIGAIAHHTWSDPDSKAGYLLVYPERVEYVPTICPLFVDVKEGMTEEEVKRVAVGNYVRAKVINSKMTTVEAVREWLMKMGARGVVVQPQKAAAVQRAEGITVNIKAGASLETSVADYVKSQFKSNVEVIEQQCQLILAEAGA